MREIFRGKRSDNGEWVEGYLWIGNDFSCITPHNVGISYDEKVKRVIAFAYEVDRKTVCQYTGLTDKNGRKIFKGDIIKAVEDCEEIYAVEWDEDIARYTLTQNGSTMTDFGDLYGDDMEVIGNIFDNPELFEGAEI